MSKCVSDRYCVSDYYLKLLRVSFGSLDHFREHVQFVMSRHQCVSHKLRDPLRIHRVRI
jgi:hypothetical protein